MSSAPSPVPAPAERMVEVYATFEQAKLSEVSADIGFARKQLADMAYNLQHEILAGLRLLQDQPRK